MVARLSLEQETLGSSPSSAAKSLEPKVECAKLIHAESDKRDMPSTLRKLVYLWYNELNMDKVAINFALPVSILREGDSFVAYTPALDLSTAGSTFEEAQKNFEEAVNIFFQELMEMGTLNDVLKDLGWGKQNNNFVPPVVVENRVQNFSIPAIN